VRAALLIARSTLRASLRRLTTPAVAAVGCLALWGGVSLEILALGYGSRALELGVATAEGVALLLAILLPTRFLHEDDTSGQGEALDGGGAGLTSRLTGRYLGAVLGAVAGAIPVLGLSLVLYNQMGVGPVPAASAWGPALVAETAVVAGWTVLLARILPPAPTALLSLLVVLVARAGVPPAVSGVLPRPVDVFATVADPRALLGQACAALATVFAACAVAPTVRSA
jgi:hypothetical protein